MKKQDIKKYYFSEVIAKDVGVEEAMMFSNIFFWVKLNEKNRDNHHYHENKYWMYNTVRDFTEQYSFWTTSKIRRILGNLEKKQYIETGVFNRFGYDKTKWYTITEKATNRVEIDKEFVENIHAFSENPPTYTR